MPIPDLTHKQILFWVPILGGVLLIALRVLFTTVGQRSANTLIINEFVAANKSGLIDEDGDHSDWIEIYNPGPRPARLAGWALTDSPDQPEKWTFPDITLDSGKYLLVFASGKDRKPTRPGAELHANFKLNQSGEFLVLRNILDDQLLPPPPAASTYPQQFTDIAYGRSAQEDAQGYLTAPTPGQPNQPIAWLDLVEPVKFSQDRGFYGAPFNLELSAQTPGATIYYTLDGSAPTETNGIIYADPIKIQTTTIVRAAAIKPGYRASPVKTHSYIFLDAVLAQPPNPPGFPKTWGGYQGAVVMADYEMDPEIVNHPRYGAALKGAFTSIPTLSIATEMRYFHDLYANASRRGRAWERPVSVEFFDPAAEKAGFMINAGVRMQGELGRSPFMPKHAFRLFFRDSYGAAKLNYPLFPDSPVESFDTLILRSGVNRSFAGYPERENDIRLTTYTRDEWLRGSQLAMSGSGSRGRFVHLYLNGLYWGLYNLVERPDDSFMASYFGGEKENWEFISHEETLTTTNRRFKTLHQLAAESQLDDPEKYAEINSYLDLPHFIDYLILNWYTGNIDWAFNNWYAGAQHSTGPVKYFVWDGERTWYQGAEIFMDKEEYLDRPNLVKPLLDALLENPDFRMMLADRLYLHLYNNGPLADANSQTRWIAINRQIEQAIIAESARWGDTRNETPLTKEDWLAAQKDVLSQMEGNADRLIALAREAGYYPDIDPPLFSPTSDAGGSSELIMLVPPETNGAIYYTTDGSDPRLEGTGAIASTARVYNEPLKLPNGAQIKARVFLDTPSGPIWSALHQATFTGVEQ